MLCQGVTKLNKDCPWKAKPKCNGFCKAHKGQFLPTPSVEPAAPTPQDTVKTDTVHQADSKLKIQEIINDDCIKRMKTMQASEMETDTLSEHSNT